MYWEMVFGLVQEEVLGFGGGLVQWYGVDLDVGVGDGWFLVWCVMGVVEDYFDLFECDV